MSERRPSAERRVEGRRGAQKPQRRAGGGGRAWMRHHRAMMGDSALRLIRRPISTLLTMLAIAIALILPAGLWLVLDSARLLDAELDESATLTVYFQADIDESEAMDLSLIHI